MTEKLRIGRIPYLNVFPIFHCLESRCDTGPYEFIEGYPSALNRMLRDGDIDISISSSIVYLKDIENFTFMDGHSISAYGPIESIMLFSRVQLESLNDQTIFVTSRSETSVALLDVLLRKFYGISCTLKLSDHPIRDAVKARSASMSIGDEALLAAKGYMDIDVEGGERLAAIDDKSFYIYDLAQLWHQKTGLPFVFALWIAKKDTMAEKKPLFDKFRVDLDASKLRAVKGLKKIAEASDTALSSKELISYWKKISYDFSDDHKKGLLLFRDCLAELGIID